MASEILSNDEEDSMDAMKSATGGEIEDGELPEEGEISDNDDDQRVTHTRILPPPPMAPLSLRHGTSPPASAHTKPGRHHAYIDLDRRTSDNESAQTGDDAWIASQQYRQHRLAPPTAPTPPPANAGGAHLPPPPMAPMLPTAADILSRQQPPAHHARQDVDMRKRALRQSPPMVESKRQRGVAPQPTLARAENAENLTPPPLPPPFMARHQLPPPFLPPGHMLPPPMGLPPMNLLPPSASIAGAESPAHLHGAPPPPSTGYNHGYHHQQQQQQQQQSYQQNFNAAPRRRYLCKFFREGHCRDGDACTFSHSAADANRPPELCKWYAETFCRKGAHCQYLHAEWPCVDYHRGVCDRHPCKYSHQQLDSFTRPIIEALFAGEQPGTSAGGGGSGGDNAIAHGPLGPPKPQRRSLVQANISTRGNLDVCEYAASLQNGYLQFIHGARAMLAPPQSMAPMAPPSGHVSIVNPIMATTGNTQQALLPMPDQGPLGPMQSQVISFTPIPPPIVSYAQQVQQQQSLPTMRGASLLATPPSAGGGSGTGQLQHQMQQNTPRASDATNLAYTVAPTAASVNASSPDQMMTTAPSQAADTTSTNSPPKSTFDINEMLKRIRSQIPINPQTSNASTTSAQTAQAPAALIAHSTPSIDESPASPPAFAGGDLSAMGAGTSIAKNIPSAKMHKHRLLLVVVDRLPNSDIKQSVLDQALTDAKLRTDPRIKRALSQQFNANTSQLAATMPQLAINGNGMMASTSSVAPAVVTAIRDPRLVRKAAVAQAHPTSGVTSLPATVSTVNPVPKPVVGVSSNPMLGAGPMGRLPMILSRFNLFRAELGGAQDDLIALQMSLLAQEQQGAGGLMDDKPQTAASGSGWMPMFTTDSLTTDSLSPFPTTTLQSSSNGHRQLLPAGGAAAPKDPRMSRKDALRKESRWT